MPRSGPGPRIGWPSTSASPEVGWISPATTPNNVDLPQPEAPTIHTSSPAPTRRLMLARARTDSPPEPKSFVISRSSSPAVIASLLRPRGELVPQTPERDIAADPDDTDHRQHYEDL